MAKNPIVISKLDIGLDVPELTNLVWIEEVPNYNEPTPIEKAETLGYTGLDALTKAQDFVEPYETVEQHWHIDSWDRFTQKSWPTEELVCQEVDYYLRLIQTRYPKAVIKPSENGYSYEITCHGEPFDGMHLGWFGCDLSDEVTG